MALQYVQYPSPTVTVAQSPIQFQRNGAPQTVIEDTVTPANNRPMPVKLENSSGDIIGQKVMATSLPVVIASDQSAVKVDGSAVTQPVSGSVSVSNFPATQAISAASLPLPTGAATSANQTTANTSLSSIDGKLASLGQKTMAGSEPVVIASDQSAIPIKAPVNSNGANTDSTVSTAATLTAPANAVGFILQNLDSSTQNIRWRIGAVATSSAGQQLQAGRDTGYIPCAANISICAESGTQNYNVQWILSS